MRGFGLILIILSSCVKSEFIPPEDKEINAILKSVIDNGSLDSGYVLCANLLKTGLSIRQKDASDTTIYKRPFAIDYNELLNYISISKSDRLNDSLYILYQINSTKKISIDSSLSTKIKISNGCSEYNNYRFFVPLLSSKKNRAYIQYHILLYDGDYLIRRVILEKNGNWEIKRYL